jgi:hypothetical protein
MVLKVTGKTVNKSEDSVADKTATESKNPIPPKEPRKRVVPKEERKKIEGNKLVINGKEKSIGRKSHYLLDMMILDDE